MLQLPVIFLLICLSLCFPAQAFLFEGPEGKLRPNNPNVCTTENINLTCTVESVSYTSADIRFNISNTRVPENKTAVVDGSSKNITLTNVTMADYNANILCCVAPCNQPNHIVEGQLLEVYDYPVGVVNFSCIRHGWENRMTCTWSLSHNYRRLPTVTVQWRIPNLSASWTPRPELVSREQCDWHNGSIGHRDIQVKVNVISQCGITVENMFNVSTKNIVKPERIPELQVKPLTSSCVNVTWTYKISPEYWKQFKIDLQSNWNDPFQPYYRNNTNGTVFEHVFCNLVPNTEYTLLGLVKPMTEGFWSDVTTAKATTPKDVPFASPGVTQGGYMWDPSQCETKDRRTVHFYYTPIPSRHENGVMKEITATSDYSFYHNSILTNKTAVPAHHTQMSVELDCYHDYTFEISAVNEIGAGDRVSKFNIPRVRHDVKIPEIIVETSENLVYLNWTVEFGIEITGFTVFWCKRDRGNCNNTVPAQWKTVSGDRNTMTIPISTPEEFLYSVSMETGQGSTGMSWESCIYAMHAEPTQNTGPPTVSTTPEDNTLSVYWNRIECVSGSPYFPFYKVVYCEWNADHTNCTATSEEIIVPVTQTSVVIQGLKEDVKYGVMVQGVTADGQEGPVSEAAFGVPENNSLKPGSIAAISIGGLVVFLFIIAGAVAVYRYCRKKIKKSLKGPDIADIRITTDENPNGYINHNYSNQSLSEDGQTPLPVSPQPYIQTNGYVTQNDVLNNMLARTNRQTSVDSGYPEDPMTPRPTGDTINFPEPIEEMASQQSLEAPISPDGIKITPSWQFLPTGYCRVNTEDDGIPRTATCPDMNNESEGPNKFGSLVSDYLDLASVINPPTIKLVPQNELVLFITAQSETTINPRNSSDDSNADKIDDRINERIKETTEAISSYSKILNNISEGNDIVEKAERESNNIPHPKTEHDNDTQGMVNTTLTNSSSNNYLSHPSVNTPTTTVANFSASSYLPNLKVNTQTTNSGNSKSSNYLSNLSANTKSSSVTNVANSSVSNNLPHLSATTVASKVANSTVSNNLPHLSATTVASKVANSTVSNNLPHLSASTVATNVANSTVSNNLPHSSATTVATNVANYSASNYLPHSSASIIATNVANTSASNYLPHSFATTKATNVANSSASNYLPHSFATTKATNVANSSASNNLPHSSATTVATNVANSSASNYLPHSFATTKATNVANSSASNYLPHSFATTKATNVANSSASNNLPHSSATTVATNVANSSASNYLPHSSASTIATNVANTSASNYLPHSFATTQATNVANSSTSNNLPHSSATTVATNVANSSASNYLPHSSASTVATNVASSSTSNYLPHSSATTVATIVANSSASNYLPHSFATTKATNVANSSASSYLTHSSATAVATIVANSSASNYLPNSSANTVSTNAANSSTSNYLPHSSATTVATNVANSSASNYLPHSSANTVATNVANSSTSNYLPHSSANTVATNVANSSTSNYLPHSSATTVATNVANSSTSNYLPHSSANTVATNVANSSANNYLLNRIPVLQAQF